MNIPLRKLLIILALLTLSADVNRAAERNLTVLNNAEMASIRGGFCIFEVCEDAPGTGVCQPVPPNAAALCALTKCKYSQSQEGNIEIFSCNFAGPETCSNNLTYRQCILAFKLSVCWNGPNPLFCGVIVEPTCTLDMVDRICVCASATTLTPCDWTSCSP